MARNAASSTASGEPTNVTTVRFVASPGSTSSSTAPGVAEISAVMESMTFRSRPSLKFGTHSINFMRQILARPQIRASREPQHGPWRPFTRGAVPFAPNPWNRSQETSVSIGEHQ